MTNSRIAEATAAADEREPVESVPTTPTVDTLAGIAERLDDMSTVLNNVESASIDKSGILSLVAVVLAFVAIALAVITIIDGQKLKTHSRTMIGHVSQLAPAYTV